MQVPVPGGVAGSELIEVDHGVEMAALEKAVAEHEASVDPIRRCGFAGAEHPNAVTSTDDRQDGQSHRLGELLRHQLRCQSSVDTFGVHGEIDKDDRCCGLHRPGPPEIRT